MLNVTSLAGFGSGAEDPIANEYFARTVGMTASCKSSIRALMRELQDNGILAELDVLCVAGDAANATNAANNSLINLPATRGSK
mgnify:CR=1 FL=1